jgi:hypothetical protein
MSFLNRSDEVVAYVAVGGKTSTSGLLEHELVAVLVLEGVGERVEVQGAGKRHGDNEIGGGNERVSGGVAVKVSTRTDGTCGQGFLRVVSSGEVTVVGGDDGVGGALLDIATVPLSNARTAGVGKNHATEFLEGLELTIALNGGANLLGTGSDGEEGLGLDAVVESVLGNGSGTAHVLVRGVGARADQTDLELLGPTVGLDGLLELADGGGKIGSEGTVDVGLELRKVDLDELVVLGTLVLAELVGVLAGEITDLRAFCCAQVIIHAVVEGEERSGSTNLSAHVAVRLLVKAQMNRFCRG